MDIISRGGEGGVAVITTTVVLAMMTSLKGGHEPRKESTRESVGGSVRKCLWWLWGTRERERERVVCPRVASGSCGGKY